MKDCPGKLMGSWKNSSFLIISSWWQPVPCKRAAYFPLMQRRTLRCLEVFLFTLRVSFWTSNYSASFFAFDWIFSPQQSAFSIQQLLSLLMANQNWSLATEASALCERFLSSKENHLLPPISPSGQVLTASWKLELCVHTGVQKSSQNMPSAWPHQWPEKSCESTSTLNPWALALINAKEWCFLGSEYRPSNFKAGTLGCAQYSLWIPKLWSKAVRIVSL